MYRKSFLGSLIRCGNPCEPSKTPCTLHVLHFITYSNIEKHREHCLRAASVQCKFMLKRPMLVVEPRQEFASLAPKPGNLAKRLSESLPVVPARPAIWQRGPPRVPPFAPVPGNILPVCRPCLASSTGPSCQFHSRLRPWGETSRPLTAQATKTKITASFAAQDGSPVMRNVKVKFWLPPVLFFVF